MYNIYVHPVPGTNGWDHYKNGKIAGIKEGVQQQINEKSIFYKEIAKESITFSLIVLLSLITGYIFGKLQK